MSSDSIHTQKRLLVVVLILFFVALNIWGYYLYQKGFFGLSADVSPASSPTPLIEKQDSVYMIPGI